MSFPARDPSRGPLRARLVFALFFTSGGLALAQEIAWSELLARSLGHESAAVAVVAATFLAGLALGAAWGARLTGACRRPLRLYGWLELGVGATSLLLLVILPQLPRWTTLIGMQPFGMAFTGLALRALIAASCLLPPTVLMGATLPALAQWRAADPPAAALAAGRLAGANASGGALGALAAVFLVLPAVGTAALLQATGALSLLVGAVALSLAGRALPGKRFFREPRLARIPGSRPRPPAWLLPALLTLAGMASLVAQMAWTRTLSWFIGPSVYTFGLLLAVTVGGMGVGHLLGATPARRSRSPLALFGSLELAVGMSIIATSMAMGHLPPLVAHLASWTRSSVRMLQAGEFALVSLLLLVPTTLVGTAFPVACRLLVERSGGVGWGVGRAGAYLTVGNVLGALGAGLLFPRFFGSRGALLVAAMSFLLVGAIASSRGASSLSRRPLLSLGSLLAAPLLWLSAPWDAALLSSGPAFNGPVYVTAARVSGQDLASVMRERGRLVFQEEGADALVTIRAAPGGTMSLQINGRTEASSGADMRAQVFAAHIPLLMVDAPQRVLVIGLASGVTAGSILARDPALVQVAELAPTVVHAAASGVFDAVSGRPLADPRVQVLPLDARTALLHTSIRYDLIASQPSNPWIPGVAALYTREFFELARSRLTPQGILGQWVQAYGMAEDDFRRILRTFASVFPHSQLYEESVGGGDYFLVGSPFPLEKDVRQLAARLTAATQRDLARVEVTSLAQLLARRVLDEAGMASYAGPGPLLTDDGLRLAYTTPLTVHQSGVMAVVRRLDEERVPPLRGLDLGHLETGEHAAFLQALASENRILREDREFLRLLEGVEPAVLGNLALPEALAQARAGLERTAYRTLMDSLEDAPGPAALQVLAGDLAAHVGENHLAIFHYRTALSLRPGSASALTGLGLALISGGEQEEAARVLRAALKADPENDRAALALAALSLQAGADQEGLDLLQQVIRRAPGWARAWSNLGVALRRLHRLPEAEAAYREALALDSGLEQAWYNLGIVLEQRGREGEARAAFQQGVSLAPWDCDLRRALSRFPGHEATLDPGAPDVAGCGEKPRRLEPLTTRAPVEG
ncbi:MAG: fused MFS/spermidine synthase [Acidobacteriota bacterium]